MQLSFIIILPYFIIGSNIVNKFCQDEQYVVLFFDFPYFTRTSNETDKQEIQNKNPLKIHIQTKIRFIYRNEWVLYTWCCYKDIFGNDPINRPCFDLKVQLKCWDYIQPEHTFNKQSYIMLRFWEKCPIFFWQIN